MRSRAVIDAPVPRAADGSSNARVSPTDAEISSETIVQ